MDMSRTWPITWHVSPGLQRFGGTDRSTGLTPGPGRWQQAALAWFYSFQTTSYTYPENGDQRSQDMATIAPEIPVLARDKAFEQLYRQYVGDVYHYALALLRNPADAEDVTQTTFMNAYRAYRRGEEILKPQNWLIKIAHNVARSRYARTKRRVKEVPLEEHVEQLALPEDERPNVEGVLRALGLLPFNQRAALVMRELEGRSYAEIADTLSVSVAAVETLIFRARRSLRVRAAALKSIAAVPLPSSLTPFFEGSSVVAGGIGTGVAVKAVVALMAGALATGLGGDHGSRADPAPNSKAAAASQRAGTLSGQAARGASADTLASKRIAKRGQGAPLRGSRPDPVQGSSLGGVAPRPAIAAEGTATQSASPAAPSPTAAVTAVVGDATDTTVGTVEQTAATVVGALPVTTPSLPPLPVQVPPLPKLP
jgi:RNA polymerase sigma factor (sigma-70 family)